MASVLGGLLAEVHVEWPPAGGPGHGGERLLRHRPHRVRRHPDPHPLSGTEILGPLRPGVGVVVGEPLLHLVERQVTVGAQTAGEVAGVQQGQPDAGVGRGLDQRMAHRVGVGVAPASAIVVQVVELPDRGVAGQDHLGVHRPGELGGRSRDPAGARPRTSGIARSRRCRSRPACDRGAPGGRRGCARWPGPAAPGRRAARRRGRPARRIAPRRSARRRSGTGPQTVPRSAARRTRPSRCVTPPPRPGRPAPRSAPARRPGSREGSAHSSGEWETPVGLRTKSIAAVIPEPARMPAS